MKIPGTREAADLLLRRVCEIEVLRGGIKERLDRIVTAARGAAVLKRAAIEKEDLSLRSALKTWFASIRGTLGERKIVSLTFGSIGPMGKSGVKFIGGSTETDVIEALARADKKLFEKFVRTSAEFNRAAVLEATPEELLVLRAIGVELGEPAVTVAPKLEALKHV